MDEADGRPGHVALQSGHRHAPEGVRTASLSLQYQFPQHRTVILSERSESKDLRFLSPPSIQSLRLFSGAEQPKAAGPTGGGELQ